MANRLANSRSPYLRQHAENPVDWYPWSEEAFLRAKLEQKPVFLSVGYSSCHWCHVMAHECFEDTEVANALNANFICVKVDREELPDIDDAYMTAVQLSSGRGGWPMSVFMTPEKKPFYAATYIPKDDVGQHPGFLTTLRQIAMGWRSSQKDFEKIASEFTMAIRGARERTLPSKNVPLQELIGHSLRALMEDFDPDFGGFGEAPKFPPHTALELLANLAAMSLDSEEEATVLNAIARMSIQTLDAMVLGGLRDHFGGGFHRYSTDRIWLVPHFEKMLYDNALMIANLAIAVQQVEQQDQGRFHLYLEALAEAIGWLGSEMTAPNGMFYAALDADSSGEEGLFYTWTLAEVEEVLGEKAPEFASAYGIVAEGNYLDEATKQANGRNIPHRANPEKLSAFPEEIKLLREARSKRERPGRDDKCIAAWNGLAIYGLSIAGTIAIAKACADAWIELGDLKRIVVDGVGEGEPYLDDYASLALGYITLGVRLGPDGEKYILAGKELVETAIKKFEDPQRGGFYLTSASHDATFGRQKPATDTPTPSANAMMARCLLRLGDLGRAQRTIEALRGWIEVAPTATESLTLALFELIESMPEPEAVSPVVEDASTAAPAKEIPSVRVDLDRREIGVGETATLLFEIPEGWHVNSNTPPARWLVPTTVTFEGVKAKVAYPEGDAYYGTVPIAITFETKGEFEIRVKWQACTDTECLEPTERRFDGVVF